MANYLIRRFLEGILVLLVTSVLIFFILHLSPGGPFDQIAFGKGRLGQDYLENMNRLLGLDRPLHERYLTWIVNVVQGDFGESWRVTMGRPVLEMIWERLGNTLQLMLASLVVSLAIALAIGILSAIKQYSVWDYLVTTLSFFGISMPIFWFGLMMIIVFSLKFREWGLPYLPVAGMATLGSEENVWDRLWHLVLPVTVLSLFQVAGWSRFIRSSMLEVLRQDFVRTARAKGLSERIVVARHALRNALIPLITVVALDLPNLFSGAIITETIFAWPGMGRLFLGAVLESDWPIAMGILLIGALLVVVSNLIADLLYAVADPRIRYS